ncbi:hypothetical protein NDU88_006911 [Pleurodeles waltl]|uniref:Uncharacterized protein n=1 Tax=Pleurodeles waltl TaxID=8319 RepID=A0AAV7UMF2_PLEWA|nr:hypothetical protein NDU88_006911 [Pleurodeles waltl]
MRRVAAALRGWRNRVGVQWRLSPPGTSLSGRGGAAPSVHRGPRHGARPQLLPRPSRRPRSKAVASGGAAGSVSAPPRQPGSGRHFDV